MYACPSEALALVVALGINFLWCLFDGYGARTVSLEGWGGVLSPEC